MNIMVDVFSEYFRISSYLNDSLINMSLTGVGRCIALGIIRPGTVFLGIEEPGSIRCTVLGRRVL